MLYFQNYISVNLVNFN